MSQPVPYQRQFDLADWASNHPSQPYDASQHDQEFNAVKLNLEGLNENIALVQRDDGRLRNGSVHPDTLSTATRLMISDWNPRGAWAAATLYAIKDVVEVSGVGYVALVAHLSTVSFAVDYAAAKWMQIDVSMEALAASDGASRVGFIQSGTGAATRTVSALLDEQEVRITNYTGGTADGSTDNTAAVTNAVADIAGTGRTLYMPRSAYPYLVSAWPQVNTGGYTIRGDGWLRKEAVIELTASSGAVRTSNVVTLKTTAAHGFSAGQTVVVANVDADGATNFNGAFTIASTPTTTTFTYAQTAANDTGGKGACSVMVSGSIIKITGGAVVGVPYGYGTGTVSNFNMKDIAVIGTGTSGSYGLATNGAQTASGFKFDNVAFFNFDYGVNPKSLSHADFYHLDVSFCFNPIVLGNGAFNVNFYGTKGQWASNIGVSDNGASYAVNFYGGNFGDAAVADIRIEFGLGVWFYGVDAENVNVLPSVASVVFAGGVYNGCINCTIAENLDTNPAVIISAGTQNELIGGAATGAGGISITSGATNTRVDNVYHNGTLTDNGIASRITDFSLGEKIPGNVAVAGVIQPKSTPSTAWAEDFTAAGVTAIGASGTYDLASGSGLVVIHDNTTGDAAVFVCYGGNVTKLGGAAAIVSGSPGASETGLFYNAGTVKYRIKNGYAVSHDYYIATIKTRASS